MREPFFSKPPQSEQFENPETSQSITERLDAQNVPAQRQAAQERLLRGESKSQADLNDTTAYEKLYEPTEGQSLVEKYDLGKVYLDAVSYDDVTPETKALLIDKLDQVLFQINPKLKPLLKNITITIEPPAQALTTLNKEVLHTRLYSKPDHLHISLENAQSPDIARQIEETLLHFSNKKATPKAQDLPKAA